MAGRYAMLGAGRIQSSTKVPIFTTRGTLARLPQPCSVRCDKRLRILSSSPGAWAALEPFKSTPASEPMQPCDLHHSFVFRSLLDLAVEVAHG